MELEKATEELNKFKKRYAAEIKSQTKKTELPTVGTKEPASQLKFTGGGFRMSADSSQTK